MREHHWGSWEDASVTIPCADLRKLASVSAGRCTAWFRCGILYLVQS
ncbi:MAG: hypothetical protein ACTSU5_01190 [Promethearchaeota archaeon]